ncbi:MAG: RNA polymerase sigma factor [Thermoleophilaceae bacterium]|nr:RNA polymerase sigma factor [Thermoleophilaceae bacterium]
MLLSRYDGQTQSTFTRKTSMDEDRVAGELEHAINRAKAGDEQALRYLYGRFADNVYGYAKGIVRDEHDAEDITQQVFARLMTALGSYEQRAVPFTSWLLRITHNMSIDHCRRRRSTPCEEVFGEDETARHDDRELSDAIKTALSELPEDQREVVVLRHFAGWSPGEIATSIGRSEDAVHGLHHRGRRQLKASLKKLDAAPVVALAA